MAGVLFVLGIVISMIIAWMTVSYHKKDDAIHGPRSHH